MVIIYQKKEIQMVIGFLCKNYTGRDMWELKWHSRFEKSNGHGAPSHELNNNGQYQ